MHVAQISMLSSNVSVREECAEYFAYYQCVGSYTPCNATSMKIYTLCENSCDTINRLTLKCLDFASIDQRILQYLTQFDCSNPLTYTTSLTLDYYDTPDDDMCSAVRKYLG